MIEAGVPTLYFRTRAVTVSDDAGPDGRGQAGGDEQRAQQALAPAREQQHGQGEVGGGAQAIAVEADG